MSPWLASLPALVGLVVFFATRHRPRAVNLGLSFGAITLAAAAGYMHERPASPDPREAALAAAMQVNLNLVRMGLEQYATDHQGHYPPAERWVAELSQHHYLPGNHLPPTPWGPIHQTNSLVLKPGAPSPHGPGHLPRSPIYGPLTYGAVLFVPDGSVYRLLAVVQRGDQAVVSGPVSAAEHL